MDAINSILVCRVGQLGDTIVTLPVLHALRHQYPDADIAYLYDRHIGRKFVLASELLEGSGLVDRLIGYPVGHSAFDTLRALLGVLLLLVKLRLQKFDLVVTLTHAVKTDAQQQRDERFFKLCGIRQSMYAHYYRQVPDSERPLKPIPHETDFFLGMLASHGVNVPAAGQGSMALNLNDRDRATFDSWAAIAGLQSTQRLLGIGPGSKMQAKRWPEERFITVVKQLTAEIGIIPVILGGKEDYETGERLINACGCGFNAAGQLSIRASAVALSHCDLYLGNDTGTMHIAVSAGVPCVAIFSARDYPGKWYPYGDGHRVHRVAVDCEGCMLQTCVEQQRKCLTAISADEVLQSCRVLLGMCEPAGKHA